MRHSLWESFRFAGRGLRVALATQRTMRVHVGLAAAVTVAAVWLDLPASGAAAVVLAVAAVLAAELMNTAVECVVDLRVGRRDDALAGRAKDLAAAAVLVTAAAAAVVGLAVLGPPLLARLGAGADALAVARAGTLAALLALALLALLPPGGGPSGRGPGREPR
jgi:diacylglycerol kinase